MNNFIRTLRQVAQRHWFTMASIFLVAGLVSIFTGLFGISIPLSISGVLLIIAFAMNLASEKILNSHLPVKEKAEFYFAIYVLVFLMLVRALVQGKFPLSTPVILAIFVFLVILVVYQVFQFRLQTSQRRQILWVLMLGLAAIVCMSIAAMVGMTILSKSA